ncbi:hypothetical protein ZWY2020_045737 [Hordeum vulgare]|nr:hypothetical protein ZWY2020_045737 [Hordeum vulgare]
MVRGSLPAPNPKPPSPSRHLLTSPPPSPTGLLSGRHHAVRADRGLRPAARRLSPPPPWRARRAEACGPLLAGLFRFMPLLLATPDDARAMCSARTPCSKPCSPGWAKIEQELRN